MDLHARSRRRRGGGNEQGVALFLALVVLLIITVLGVSGLQTTTLEERMAANARDRDLAFQAAEAALSDAERFLNNASLPPFGNAAGLYELNAVNRPIWAGSSQQTGNGVITYSLDRPGVGAQATPLGTVAQQPQYFIEQFPLTQLPGGTLEAGVAADELSFFRITARGFGGRASTVVVLQSGYQR